MTELQMPKIRARIRRLGVTISRPLRCLLRKTHASLSMRVRIWGHECWGSKGWFRALESNHIMVINAMDETGAAHSGLMTPRRGRGMISRDERRLKAMCVHASGFDVGAPRGLHRNPSGTGR
jgi:hypothetical protein